MDYLRVNTYCRGLQSLYNVNTSSTTGAHTMSDFTAMILTFLVFAFIGVLFALFI
jgi:hypothetical protein